jgi:hypothetical protein
LSYSSEIKDNRLNLLKLFLTDQELVDLIANEIGHRIPALDLRYKQVFPYLWTKDTITEKKVFLCFTLASRANGSNTTTKKNYIRIYVFMHEDLIEMDNCIRPDAILGRIEELLNGSDSLGTSDVEFVTFDDIRGLPKDYYGIYVEYSVKNLNRWKCG